MEFDNSFEVPLPPASAWPVLLDVPRIVQCMPGAELTDVVDSTTYKGRVSVRLGPVNLSFAGTVSFSEIDPVAHSASASARGNDSKGRGGASATVRFKLDPSEAGSRVAVHTTLTLTGSVAQYGRATGVVRELAGQLTSEFAQRLRAQIEAEQVFSQAAATTLPGVETAAYQPPESLSAAGLIWRTIVAYLRRLLVARPG